MSDTGRGTAVVYVATRSRYLDEAWRSARSVKRHMDVDIHLFTSLKLRRDARRGPFDRVIGFDDHVQGFADSILDDTHLVADKILFLDSDTFVASSLSDVFDELDHTDLVCCWDPTRTGTAPHTHEHDVPETWPQVNTGVLGLRDCPDIRYLLDRWRVHYERQREHYVAGLNQPAFRQAVHEVKPDMHVLPAEYNWRLGTNANQINYAAGPVKIIHGRSTLFDLDELADLVNETEQPRIVSIKDGRPVISTNDDVTASQRALRITDRSAWKLYKDGLSGLIRAGGQLVRESIGGVRG